MYIKKEVSALSDDLKGYYWDDGNLIEVYEDEDGEEYAFSEEMTEEEFEEKYGEATWSGEGHCDVSGDFDGGGCGE